MAWWLEPWTATLAGEMINKKLQTDRQQTSYIGQKHCLNYKGKNEGNKKRNRI